MPNLQLLVVNTCILTCANYLFCHF